MSGAAETEAPRPRPLSGGLWTLFSWLRRDDHSSSESLSSVGSDRTAASFAFLAPGHYDSASPVVLPPPGPPTDSYKKRVRDRHLRRQHDRDLTLHRKYGLYGFGYDAFSLPNARRASSASGDKCERDRRATSESPRAHVPGKRRAPLPPSAPTSLTRRRARKRRAPPPPVNLTPNIKENIYNHNVTNADNNSFPMNRQPLQDKQPSQNLDSAMGCKPEKYCKKDGQAKDMKEVKVRHEKNFLRQIFENRKRNSAIETASVKLLPSISELDKQAADMIEKYRLKELSHNSTTDKQLGKDDSPGSSKQQTEAWICIRCLRKYNSSVITCNYCLPLNKNSESYKSSNASNSTQTKCDTNIILGRPTSRAEDKEKLKEMLKEMKDSLPKRPKNDLITTNRTNNTTQIEDYPKIEAPTLRIGTSTHIEKLNLVAPATSPNHVGKETSVSEVLSQKLKQQQDNKIHMSRNLILGQPNSDISSNPIILHSRENKSAPKDSIPITQRCDTKLVGQKTPVTQINSEENKKELRERKFVTQSSLAKDTDRLNKELSFSKKGTQKNKEIKELNSVPLTSSAHTPDKEAVVSQVNKKELATINNVSITKPVVLVHATQSNVILDKCTSKNTQKSQTSAIQDNSNKKYSDNFNSKILQIATPITITEPKPLNISKPKYDLNTPLKISSLLNPIYIPKNTIDTINPTSKTLLQIDDREVKAQKATGTSNISENILEDVIGPAGSSTSQVKLITPNAFSVNKDNCQISKMETKVENSEKASNEEETQIKADSKKLQNDKIISSTNIVTEPLSMISSPSTSKEGRVDQHIRRRDLINQLERSIAKGDEHAAADAAVKLAQLRLSCSVLSFSSQIVAETSTSSAIPEQITDSVLIKESKCKKEIDGIQKSSQASVEPEKVIQTKLPSENKVKSNIETVNDKHKKEQVGVAKTESSNLIVDKVESFSKVKAVKDNKKAVVTQNSAPCEASTSKGVIVKNENHNEDVPILVWVEDKDTTRGPVQLHVRRNAVMGDLRKQAERSLGLNSRMQRWIVGRSLCTDDNVLLVTLAGSNLTAPFYLCLVESETKDTNIIPEVDGDVGKDPGNVYNELMKLEQQALVTNAEAFECGVCIEECPPGVGVVLRECVHSFCKECLSDVVRHSEDPIVGCPATGCRGILQEREVRGLVSPEDYEKWLARGLATAESGTRNAFHCRTRDCTGWALCEPGVRRFPCPVCKCTNCVPCQAIHEGETCEQHQLKQKETAASPDASQTDEGTRALLNTLISRGEALECPECSTIITKKWGCDWIKCSACKTEICWVTKGRRWGPAGRGDTSGGCRCGIDGKRCHPSCGYCH